jgi:hypothetical protein
MDQSILISNIQGALDNVRYNITKLTERYCDSADTAGSYTDALEPLLEHQLTLLNFLSKLTKL